jgi:hypothetical protein
MSFLGDLELSMRPRTTTEVRGEWLGTRWIVLEYQRIAYALMP